MNKKGKLIVFEGVDGSGKGLQTRMVIDRLRSLGKKVEMVDFPQYKDSFFGGMIGKMMAGEFGSLENLNPHLVSPIFAFDRWKAKPYIEKWLVEGKIIVANRYVCSNMGHQTAKLPESERENFLEFLEKLEYEELGIPKEDLVIFLHFPPEICQKLVDKKNGREHLGDKKRDLHEADIVHLQKASENYLYLTEKYPHWAKISCCGVEGNLMIPEVIHEEVMKVLEEKGII